MNKLPDARGSTDWEEALDSATQSLKRHCLEPWELELVRSRVKNALGGHNGQQA